MVRIFCFDSPGLGSWLTLLGPATSQFERWASSKGIDVIASVGRDMGAAPPRQTEVKFAIPGGMIRLIEYKLFLRAHSAGSFETQLNTALTAFPALNVPDIPNEALKIIRGQCTAGLVMSVCCLLPSIALCLLTFRS